MLTRRETLQKQLDEWHKAGRGRPMDFNEYKKFLGEIGYLQPEGPDFTVDTDGIDEEFTTIAGPQLMVPITNARYTLNAANARWGSLYDVLYGTDAMGDLPTGTGYDPARGQRIIAWAKAFLDEVAPLEEGSHADAAGYAVEDGKLTVALENSSKVALSEAEKFVGYRGEAAHRPLCCWSTTRFMLSWLSTAPRRSAGPTRRACPT